MTRIISADEIKKTLPGFTPEHSEQFHRASAKIADHQYADTLKNGDEKGVILLSGGTASGKSEYVSVYLMNENAIIFDGTLPTFNGAKIKIEKATKAKKLVEICAVLPSSLLVAFIAFLNRERQFPVEHFYHTHFSSRKTLLEIANSFPDVPIRVIISECKNIFQDNPTMNFHEKSFKSRQELIAFLEQNQYTEEEIINKVFQK